MLVVGGTELECCVSIVSEGYAHFPTKKNVGEGNDLGILPIVRIPIGMLGMHGHTFRATEASTQSAPSRRHYLYTHYLMHKWKLDV